MTAPLDLKGPPSAPAPLRPHILLVDDNELDVELTLLALTGCGLRGHVSTVGDGQEALDFLRGVGRHAGRPPGLPALVLLDLKMLGLDGEDVLRAIRDDPALRRTRVAMLTTSGRPEDRACCGAADAYLVKPLDPAEFVRQVGEVVSMILTARRPAQEPGPPG
ncbi:response regulator with CheY-like receiver, AAA-type ATPase, DNA-binding domains [Deinococcus aerius]|uniref:Response regulator with CheY-like receiver, AAA-type ATPase, DNA-binding domains n=1 Tax=Deinococcus aerius TaxID=200253 RepID=A0A2I9D0B4_9DEIO|nr:response regulator [Deinococcus aerius]GBF07959.1 response regulator with CheY-like receiver, AAA-type ATPase, DNA-binding domains [Deinococcus aerius]